MFLMALVSHIGVAQKLTSTKSSTTFFSSAVLEDITATSKKGKSVIDRNNGQIAFVVSIKSFEFVKSLMQEHFNEKYMESEKYPKANFSGTIIDWKAGESLEEATATGKLTIHGVTQNITAKGSVKYEKKKLLITAKFKVKLDDYDVEVPSLMFQKIAEVVEVTINYEYPTNEN
jgi:polyisoprenoid-binding protein YceI